MDFFFSFKLYFILNLDKAGQKLYNVFNLAHMKKFLAEKTNNNNMPYFHFLRLVKHI